ncbi:MAG: hypothetical protein R2883_07355 [Caldisericia bacterium]
MSDAWATKHQGRCLVPKRPRASDPIKMSPSFYIHTLGCQMNKSDSEFYSSILESSGYTASETDENADIVMINTCAVREASVHKMESKIGEWAAKRRKTGKPGKIGVIGCVPKIDMDVFKREHREAILKLGTYPDKESTKNAIISELPFHVDDYQFSDNSISAYVPTVHRAAIVSVHTA